MSLRPSNLPKLALCACYEADPNPGPAAERGTALDGLFRGRMQGQPDQAEMFYSPIEEDNTALAWAMTTVRVLAGNTAILTKEKQCRVTIPGFENPGTADAILPERLAHADLKSGQKRNYREQMAAYALGFMEQHFASEWTAHLLFCDQKEVVTHQFTYAEAQALVNSVIERYHDPVKAPTPCEYCGWCAQRETCSARLALATNAMTIGAPGFDFAGILADNERLGKFLTACAVLEDFKEQAEAVAKQRLEAKIAIPGWKLSTRKGAEFVRHDDVGRYLPQLGFGDVLAAYGNLSAKQFREVWTQKLPNEPFPEEVVKHARASSSLCAQKSKS